MSNNLNEREPFIGNREEGEYRSEDGEDESNSHDSRKRSAEETHINCGGKHQDRAKKLKKRKRRDTSSSSSSSSSSDGSRSSTGSSSSSDSGSSDSSSSSTSSDGKGVKYDKLTYRIKDGIPNGVPHELFIKAVEEDIKKNYGTTATPKQLQSSSKAGSSSSSAASTSKQIKVDPDVGPNGINTIKSEQQQRQSVVDWLCEEFAKPATDNDFMQLLYNRFEELIPHLKTIQVVASHGKSPIVFRPDGLSHLAANKLPFALKVKQHMTVAWHYAKRGIVLAHPEWPCVLQKGGPMKGGGCHMSYFPIELMQVFSYPKK